MRVVTTPAGWKETYKAWADSGWNAIAGPEEFGGQGLASHDGAGRFAKCGIRPPWLGHFARC